MKFKYLLITLAFLITSCSSSPQYKSLSLLKKSLNKHSKTKEMYSGISHIITISSYLLSPEIQRRTLDLKKDWLGMSQETFQKKLGDINFSMKERATFLVTAYASNHVHGNLDKKSSVWKATLFVGNKRYEGTFQTYKEPNEILKRIMPNLNSFADPYLLSFKTPIEKLRGQKVTLVLSSALGQYKHLVTSF